MKSAEENDSASVNESLFKEKLVTRVQRLQAKFILKAFCPKAL